MGEEAEDGGGPRRELWRLLAVSIKSAYFEGVEDNLIIRHDTLAVQVILLLYVSLYYSTTAVPVHYFIT